jgi:hypothetical protein
MKPRCLLPWRRPTGQPSCSRDVSRGTALLSGGWQHIAHPPPVDTLPYAPPALLSSPLQTNMRTAAYSLYFRALLNSFYPHDSAFHVLAGPSMRPAATLAGETHHTSPTCQPSILCILDTNARNGPPSPLFHVKHRDASRPATNNSTRDDTFSEIALESPTRPKYNRQSFFAQRSTA